MLLACSHPSPRVLLFVWYFQKLRLLLYCWLELLWSTNSAFTISCIAAVVSALRGDIFLFKGKDKCIFLLSISSNPSAEGHRDLDNHRVCSWGPCRLGPYQPFPTGIVFMSSVSEASHLPSFPSAKYHPGAVLMTEFWLIRKHKGSTSLESEAVLRLTSTMILNISLLPSSLSLPQAGIQLLFV